MNNITPQVALDAITRVGLKILSAAALFVVGTTINTPDNVQTIVGNNKILSDNIQNF